MIYQIQINLTQYLQVMYHNNTSAAPVAPMNMETTPAGAGGMTTSTIYPNPTIFRQNINPTNHQNGFAIAAFVISALWLIDGLFQ